MATTNNLADQCITSSQMNMISNSRIFFRRFTTWIRVFIISRYLGIGTEEESFSRLYFETSDIGNIFQIIFDRESSSEISLLLNQLTFSIRDLLTAQQQGNSDAMNQSVERLYQIADHFAAFFASINPYLNEAEWRNMMETYIQYTIEEANSFVTGNYSNDIELFRQLTDLTNRMGDQLAQSLYDYLIAGYHLSPQSDLQCITYDQMNQIFEIRMFWYELITWTRAYMLSRYRGIGNADEVFARLNQTVDEYISALNNFLGVTLETYSQLLHTYILLLDQLISAQLEGNVDEINKITQLLTQNADQRASQIAAINPIMEEHQWRTLLYNILRYTIEQSTTFLNVDYSRNLDIFRTLLDLAENTSNYFAKGLFRHLISQQKSINMTD